MLNASLDKGFRLVNRRLLRDRIEADGSECAAPCDDVVHGVMRDADHAGDLVFADALVAQAPYGIDLRLVNKAVKCLAHDRGAPRFFPRFRPMRCESATNETIPRTAKTTNVARMANSIHGLTWRSYRLDCARAAPRSRARHRVGSHSQTHAHGRSRHYRIAVLAPACG